MKISRRLVEAAEDDALESRGMGFDLLHRDGRGSLPWIAVDTG